MKSGKETRKMVKEKLVDITKKMNCFVGCYRLLTHFHSLCFKLNM